MNVMQNKKAGGKPKKSSESALNSRDFVISINLFSFLKFTSKFSISVLSRKPIPSGSSIAKFKSKFDKIFV